MLADGGVAGLFLLLPPCCHVLLGLFPCLLVLIFLLSVCAWDLLLLLPVLLLLCNAALLLIIMLLFAPPLSRVPLPLQERMLLPR